MIPSASLMEQRTDSKQTIRWMLSKAFLPIQQTYSTPNLISTVGEATFHFDSGNRLSPIQTFSKTL